MSYSFQTVIKDEVQRFINENGLKEEVKSEQIVRAVLTGSAYYEIQAGGKKLILFRLFSPVTQREEVFVGNVLLNSFLGKNILLSCREKGLGRISLVANDIENFYYLWWTDKKLEDLKEAYLVTLEKNLEDLYFRDRNEEKGIYGEFSKLFEFYKNNHEAFPIFSIPETYMHKLGVTAREYIVKQINECDNENIFVKSLSKITANIAFFLSKQSPKISEFQSPYYLIARAVTAYKNDTKLSLKELKEALNLDKEYETSNIEDQIELKDDIDKAIKKGLFSYSRFKTFLLKLLYSYNNLAIANPKEWNMEYAREKGLKLKPGEIVTELLSQVQIGYMIFDKNQSFTGNIYCRCCGYNYAMFAEKQIMMGDDINKFNNQMVNYESKKESRICIKCYISSFLIIKLTGTVMGAKTFVPQQGSMIFHYGRHSDEEVKAIAATLKNSLELINERRDLRYSLAKLRKDQREVLSKLEKASEKKRKDLETQKNAIETQLKEATYKAKRSEIMLVELMKGESNIDDDPAITLLTEANIEIDAAENHVFGVGLGNYRLMVFILPQIRYRVEKKAHNYIQERFSASRVNTLILLSFLRKLCGCDGPYYYMCLPSIVEGNFSTDAFYVRDGKYSAAEVMEYYEVFATFSNKVIRWEEERNRRMIKRILLSEKVMEEPLITLSEIMRHSKIFSPDGDDRYKVIYDPISHRPDIDEYFEIFMKGRAYQIHKTREVER